MTRPFAHCHALLFQPFIATLIVVAATSCLAPRASAQALPGLTPVEEKNVQLVIDNLEFMLSTLQGDPDVVMWEPEGNNKFKKVPITNTVRVTAYAEVLENLKMKKKDGKIHPIDHLNQADPPKYVHGVDGNGNPATGNASTPQAAYCVPNTYVLIGATWVKCPEGDILIDKSYTDPNYGRPIDEKTDEGWEVKWRLLHVLVHEKWHERMIAKQVEEIQEQAKARPESTNPKTLDERIAAAKENGADGEAHKTVYFAQKGVLRLEYVVLQEDLKTLKKNSARNAKAITETQRKMQWLVDEVNRIEARMPNSKNGEFAFAGCNGTGDVHDGTVAVYVTTDPDYWRTDMDLAGGQVTDSRIVQEVFDDVEVRADAEMAHEPALYVAMPEDVYAGLEVQPEPCEFLSWATENGWVHQGPDFSSIRDYVPQLVTEANAAGTAPPPTRPPPGPATPPPPESANPPVTPPTPPPPPAAPPAPAPTSAPNRPPDFNHAVPSVDSNGITETNAYQVTICQGTSYVLPIGGQEVDVRNINNGNPSSAVGGEQGNGLSITGRSVGVSTIQADVIPTDGTPPVHITIRVNVIDCNQPRTTTPPQGSALVPNPPAANAPVPAATPPPPESANPPVTPPTPPLSVPAAPPPAVASSTVGPGILALISNAISGVVNSALSAPSDSGYQLFVVFVTAPPPAPNSPSGPTSPTGGSILGTNPERTQASHGTASRLRAVAYHSSDGFPSFVTVTNARLAMAQNSSFSSAGQSFAGVTYSIVSNGKSNGQALELQMLDPSGRVKQVAIPEGTVLEPVKRGAARPVSDRAPRGANLLTKQVSASCLEFAKLPPESNMQYRIAPQALQEKYKPIRGVLQASREAAATGKLHPDSDPNEYANDIRQYALWSKLENWGEQEFTQKFLEHTKKNAQAMNVTWTNQMEQAVLGLAPGRWRDVSMVLDEAQKLPAP